MNESTSGTRDDALIEEIQSPRPAVANGDPDTASHSSAIIDVRDLWKIYHGRSWGRRRRIEAVRGVTLQAFSGEVFGLLGPNGAGKTTLIKMLLGVVKPTGGTASLFGRPIGSDAARARVGYLPESLRVDRHHTARTALKFYGRMSRMGDRDIARRSDELLELVGLRGRDRESVRRFSKGMYQRLGLAQALMHDPDLLVLDEPTDGLDPVGRSEVRRVIERLREAGKAIFLNSHILQEVELVCTRVAILSHGKIRAIGRIDELSHSSDADHVAIEFQLTSAQSSDTYREVLIAELNGLLDQIRARDGNVESLPVGDRQVISANVTDQSQIDAIVDFLRGRDVSIRELHIRRPTLEDTFMKLVGQREMDLQITTETNLESLQSDRTSAKGGD